MSTPKLNMPHITLTELATHINAMPIAHIRFKTLTEAHIFPQQSPCLTPLWLKGILTAVFNSSGISHSAQGRITM